MFERILHKMLKDNFTQSLYNKFFYRSFLNLKFFVHFRKIYLLIFSPFFLLFFDSKNNFANSDHCNIKKYVNKAEEIKCKQRTSQILPSKSNGQKIKYFLKKSSKNQSRKVKNKQAADKMSKTGITTKNLVKKNRWFVKKPFQKTFTKISSVKRVKRPQVDSGVNKEISLMASKITRNRARETGSTKPEILFSGDNSRNVQKMTNSQARISGPAKTGPVFTEDSGRIAMDISKTRARETGPVKPTIIYSNQVSRKALKMASNKNKKNTSTEITYTGQRYSVEYLRSLSRRNTSKNGLHTFGSSNLNLKRNNDNNTDNKLNN